MALRGIAVRRVETPLVGDVVSEESVAFVTSQMA